MQGWHVIVPGLCGPFPRDVELGEQATQPLQDLLQGAETMPAADNYHAQLAELFALPQPLPSAVLSLCAEDLAHADKYCMQLAPVHLHADMDHAILYDEFALDLSAQEKQQLQKELNAHFEQDGIEIINDAQGRWFVLSDQAFDLNTTPLHEVIGRNIHFHLPSGNDASRWKAFLNEAQMLMYQSEVNNLREQQGKLAANSVWLWGQGGLPDNVPALCVDVYSNDELAKGAACITQCRQHDLPQTGTALPQHAVFCDNRLLSAASYGDAERWAQHLREMMQQWLQALVTRAKQQGIPVTVYPCHGSAYQLSAGGWRNVVTRLFACNTTAHDLIRYDD